MATLAAELKRAILDELWYTAPEGVGLEACIRAYKSSRFADVKTGRFVTNTSGGGYAVSFNVPEIVRQLTPEQLLMLCQEYLELLDSCRVILGGTPSDDDLFQSMMQQDQMQTVRELQRDYTCLRWPAVGVGSR
jgi:hypothetical protein